MTNVVTRPESLSARLRSATRVEHERTESSAFVVALMDGRLDRGAYAALLGQSWLFYSVLEEAGESWRHDAVVGPFVSDALVRRDALEADLAWLNGPGWRDEVRALPATGRYVDRLREVCFTSRGAFVAHHYTRYLGDLSERSVLPQHTTVAFPFTVGQVVAMGRAPWARTDRVSEDDAAIAEAMAATEVTSFADRTFSTLSGGERARVALARVLAQRTPILLLDEPTAALDLRHQDLVLSVALERAHAGTAVLAVLHDLNLAAAYADRVAVVADGRLAACGPPAEVLTAELLSEVYQRTVEVFAHPRSGTPLVLPVRTHGAAWDDVVYPYDTARDLSEHVRRHDLHES